MNDHACHTEHLGLMLVVLSPAFLVGGYLLVEYLKKQKLTTASGVVEVFVQALSGIAIFALGFGLLFILIGHCQ